MSAEKVIEFLGLAQDLITPTAAGPVPFTVVKVESENRI